MGAITKLEAINDMLRNAGENTVSDLETDYGIDLSQALELLSRETRDVQLRGLANNKWITEIEPDGSGIIYVPENTLSAKLLSYNLDRMIDEEYVTLRGYPSPYLYNTKKRTNVWDAGKYTVEILEDLPWEDIETPVQRWIMAEASRRYQSMTQGDPDVDRYLAEQAAYYKAKAIAHDTEKRDRNMLYSNDPGLQRVHLRRYQGRTSPRFWRS